MRMRTVLTAAALLSGLPLAACASAGDYRAPAYGEASGYATATVASGGYAAKVSVREEADGLLSEPPADAKAGQCFAKVVVPGQPVYGPPTLQPHMRWVQSPPQPGTIGPIWCQVWEQGYQPTVTYTPERYGWIRVICDHDATVEKIGHIQHRLHDWGYYNGGYDGHYDAATAEAVKRFQGERHIEHGGYLSFKTMEVLEQAPPPPAPPSALYAQGYGYPPAPTYQPPAPCGGPCAPPAPVIAPCPGPCAPPPVAPCGPNPCQGGGYPVAYGQQQGGYGYGQGYSNTRRYSVQRAGY